MDRGLDQLKANASARTLFMALYVSACFPHALRTPIQAKRHNYVVRNPYLIPVVNRFL
jgi:hypothetical protein